MFTLSIVNGSWSVEFKTALDLSIVSSDAIALIQKILNLHAQVNLLKVTMNNEIFKLEFVDGRIWKIRVLNQEEDSDINMLIANNDSWTRSLISGFITPITTQLMIINSTYLLSSFTMTKL